MHLCKRSLNSCTEQLDVSSPKGDEVLPAIGGRNWLKRDEISSDKLSLLSIASIATVSSRVSSSKYSRLRAILASLSISFLASLFDSAARSCSIAHQWFGPLKLSNLAVLCSIDLSQPTKKISDSRRDSSRAKELFSLICKYLIGVLRFDMMTPMEEAKTFVIFSSVAHRKCFPLEESNAAITIGSWEPYESVLSKYRYSVLKSWATSSTRRMFKFVPAQLSIPIDPSGSRIFPDAKSQMTSIAAKQHSSAQASALGEDRF
mmetsp:Transcript_5507/g.12761  ORF Transcript_5507/g.12761 Transcript_5507/m.12761 type:complete len:261 (-) Transcript_5507:1722-2504(-)